jgi:hypothetical protein
MAPNTGQILRKWRLRWLVAGLLLMIYPYFTSSVAPLIGVGALICGALWYAVRAGW